MNSRHHQRGLILASGILLLATGMLSMTTVMGIAVRELNRTQVIESLEQARQAAAIGLATALSTDELTDTSSTELFAVLADGSRWQVTRSFLGLTPDRADPSLAEWHFLLESEATTSAGAMVRQRLQVRLPAPPPADVSVCLEQGCLVPPLCGPPDPMCPLDIRARPLPVAWHLPENGA